MAERKVAFPSLVRKRLMALGACLAFILALTSPSQAFATDSNELNDTGINSTDGTAVTGDGFALVDGKDYKLGVSFLNVSGNGKPSMAADFMEKEATVTYSSELGTYTVAVVTNKPEWIGRLTYNGNMFEGDNGTFTITGIDQIASTIRLGMHVTIMEQIVGNGDVDVDMLLDTSQFTGDGKTGGKKPSANKPISNTSNGSSGNTGNGSNKPKGNGTNNTNGPTTLFEAGHTYSVPMSVYKAGNTSDLSMADGYFGDYAYVRPSSDLSTLSISFTTNGLEFIESLTYNGSSVPLSDATFTLEVPYTEQDLKVTLDMVIIPMAQLGMGTVSADFYFYLTNATDLGADVAATDIPSGVSGAASKLASTGANSITAGIIAALVLASLGCLLILKRRTQDSL